MNYDPRKQIPRLLVNWETFYIYESELSDDERQVVDRFVRQCLKRKQKLKHDAKKNISDRHPGGDNNIRQGANNCRGR